MIGLVIGLLVAKLGIPSFVVTLAFFLGLQGVTLQLIGQGGTVPVRDDVLRGIANKTMPVVTRLDRGRSRCSRSTRGLLLLAPVAARRQEPAPPADSRW